MSGTLSSKLRSSTVQVLLATVATYLAAFAVSKTVAERFGPEGVAIAGALLGTASIAASIALMGQQNSLPVWVANHQEEPSSRTVALAVRATTGVLPLGLAPTAVLGAAFIGEYGALPVVVTGIVLATTAQVWTMLSTSLLSALKGPGALLGQAVRTGAISSVLTCLGLMTFESSLLPLVLGLGSVLGSVAGTSPYLGKTRVILESRGRPSRQALKAYRRAGWGSLIGVVANALVIGGLPLLVLTLTSETTAGLFRAAWSLTAVLLAVAYFTLKGLYLPAVARSVVAQQDSRALNEWIVKRLLLIVVAGSTLVALLSSQLLVVFFSQEFSVAATALATLTMMTTARAGVYLNQFWLSANGRMRDFSLVEVIFTLLLLVGVVLGCQQGTSEAVAMGCTLSAWSALVASSLLLKVRRLPSPFSGTPWWGWCLLAVQLLAVAGMAQSL